MLPAYAGMILEQVLPLKIVYRAPRVCGDDPAASSSSPSTATCSPRMRG